MFACTLSKTLTDRERPDSCVHHFHLALRNFVVSTPIETTTLSSTSKQSAVRSRSFDLTRTACVGSGLLFDNFLNTLACPASIFLDADRALVHFSAPLVFCLLLVSETALEWLASNLLLQSRPVATVKYAYGEPNNGADPRRDLNSSVYLHSRNSFFPNSLICCCVL